MRNLALAATILIVATGCDKPVAEWPQEIAKGYNDFIYKVSGAEKAARPPAPRVTPLDGKPTVLFQVFGKRSDPRMVPVAVLENGELKRIVLGGREWRQFDRLYAAPGQTLTLYQDGRRVGVGTVKRGMWQEGDTALYRLPGCELALPLASLVLSGDVATAPSTRSTVELLASNGPLGRIPEPVTMSPLAVERTSRDIGTLVGANLRISPRTLDSLDFRAIAVPTGSPGRPTLVINYLDPAVNDTAKSGKARQMLIFADQGPYGYGPTYWHFQRGLNPNPQFRRYVDHLDLDGDGRDEMILEAWYAQRPGTFYVVLGRETGGGGLWQERYRGDQPWCLDGQVARLAAEK